MVKEMNYTKGEWLIAEEDRNFVYCLCNAGINTFSLLVQGGYDNNNKRTSKEELEANAHLIASAPLMYEALKEADNLIKLARQYFPKSIRNSDTFQLETTCAAIGKAIAKVEGR